MIRGDSIRNPPPLVETPLVKRYPRFFRFGEPENPKIFRLRRAKMHAIFYSKIPTVRSENPKIFRLRRAKMYDIFYSKTPPLYALKTSKFPPAAGQNVCIFL